MSPPPWASGFALLFELPKKLVALIYALPAWATPYQAAKMRRVGAEMISVTIKIIGVLTKIICVPAKTISVATQIIWVPIKTILVSTKIILEPTETILEPTKMISMPTKIILAPTNAILVPTKIISVPAMAVLAADFATGGGTMAAGVSSLPQFLCRLASCRPAETINPPGGGFIVEGSAVQPQACCAASAMLRARVLT